MRDNNDKDRRRIRRKNFESSEDQDPAPEQHDPQEPRTINDRYKYAQEQELNRRFQEMKQGMAGDKGNGKPPPTSPQSSRPPIDFRNRVTDLDAPLLRFNLGDSIYNARNCWTLRDAVRGVQIFGGIGSGKSSGSGLAIALTYLRSGFGGIVLTGKVDEVEQWRKYAKLTGREDDLVVFEKGSDLQFNALEYEAGREGSGGGETLNLTNLIMDIYEMGQSFMASGGGGGSNERFWDNALKRYIVHAIGLLITAGEEVSIFNLRKILISALTKEEVAEYNQLRQAAKENQQGEIQSAFERLNAWIAKNFCLECLNKAYRRTDKTESEQERYQRLIEYFLKVFPRIPEKTRSIIEESFLGLVEPFMDGILREYFTQGVSDELRPEETYLRGKIIVINFPVKEYLIAGVYAQAIFKKIWQEVIERRNADEHPLPVFMWIDESQYFLNQHDARFQTTARSSRACTVLITQNIPNYYSAIGGKNPKDDVNSLLGNLATKIFHANNDHVTNSWAADTIGKTFRSHRSTSANLEHMHGSTTMSESLNYQIEPQQFTTLRAGGAENSYLVEGIMTVAGKEWSNGRNFIKVVFSQKFQA